MTARDGRAWVAALGVVATLVVAGGCPAGRPVRLGGAGAGRVAAVLPYELSDTDPPLPGAALLCYADDDCVIHTVRQCCPSCHPQRLAVNGAALHAIERHHEAHPCPAGEECPEIACPEGEEIPPTVRCLQHRCTLTW